PLPIFIRDVTAANAAIGTIASRTRRDSACQTASKPRCSAYCAYAIPSRMSCLSCRYIATHAIEFSFQRTMFPQFDDLNVVFATECILLLLDFAETDRPIFNMGLLRRQRHDHRDTPITSRNGDRPLVKHGIYEGSHLRDEALGITLYEKAEWLIAPDTTFIANDGGVGIVVTGRDNPCAAQQFHALIIAVNCMTTVANRSDHAVGKL